jgi:O-glycosyl hydrolase
MLSKDGKPKPITTTTEDPIANSALSELTDEKMMKNLFNEEELKTYREELQKLLAKKQGDAQNNTTDIEHQYITMQIDLLQSIRRKYNVTIVLSSWSPPYIWKRFPVMFGFVKRLPFNHLLKRHFPDFAKYLVDYIKFYEANNLTIHAISPQNEPEYPSQYWEGCFWSPWSLGEFTHKHLKPQLQAENIDVKIIGPECANPWYAEIYSSVASHYSKNNKGIDIYASHG